MARYAASLVLLSAALACATAAAVVSTGASSRGESLVGADTFGFGFAAWPPVWPYGFPGPFPYPYLGW